MTLDIFFSDLNGTMQLISGKNLWNFRYFFGWWLRHLLLAGNKVFYVLKVINVNGWLGLTHQCLSAKSHHAANWPMPAIDPCSEWTHAANWHQCLWNSPSVFKYKNVTMQPTKQMDPYRELTQTPNYPHSAKWPMQLTDPTHSMSHPCIILKQHDFWVKGNVFEC